jgi:hypothetical protein
MNREAWLQKVVTELETDFSNQGHAVPPVQVSVGWPSSNRHKRIGECWPSNAAEDGINQMFVSPRLQDTLVVIPTVAHEMVHAVLDNKHGHKKPFKDIAVSVGLEGKMTATVASDALKERCEAIVAKIGAYPHAGLVEALSTVPKQTTRMLLLKCAECDFKYRTTQKWIDQYQNFPCPCGEDMEIMG